MFVFFLFSLLIFFGGGGGAHFSWGALWVLHQEWHSHKMKFWTKSGIITRWSHATVGRHFGEAAVAKGDSGSCPIFALYPGICLTTDEKSLKTLSLQLTFSPRHDFSKVKFPYVQYISVFNLQVVQSSYHYFTLLKAVHDENAYNPE